MTADDCQLLRQHRSHGGIPCFQPRTTPQKHCYALPSHPTQHNITIGADAKAFFDEVLPMFSPIVRTADLERFAAQKDSKLPRFSYVGPILHRGRTTCLLGSMRRHAAPRRSLGVHNTYRITRPRVARTPLYMHILQYFEFDIIRSRHSHLSEF